MSVSQKREVKVATQEELRFSLTPVVNRNLPLLELDTIWILKNVIINV